MPSWKLDKKQMREVIKGLRYLREGERLYENAYWHWRRDHRHHQLESELDTLSKFSIEAEYDWLSRLRKARFLGVRGAAALLGVTKSAYTQIEQSEKRKSITLKKLQHVADAFDCEVVYFMRPKNNARYSEHVWLRFFKLFKDDPYVLAAPGPLRHKALVRLIRRKLSNAQFRKQMGWSLKDN